MALPLGTTGRVIALVIPIRVITGLFTVITLLIIIVHYGTIGLTYGVTGFPIVILPFRVVLVRWVESTLTAFIRFL